MLVAGGAVMVSSGMLGGAGVIRHLHGRRVATMFGATVEAARVEQGSLEPDGPNGSEGAEPHGATHDVQTIHRVGGDPTLRTQTAWDRGHSAASNGVGSRPVCGLAWHTGPDLGLEVGRLMSDIGRQTSARLATVGP